MDYLKNINIINSTDKEKEKFCFLLLTTINNPYLRIILDYIIDKTIKNQVLVKFCFDDSINKALEKIGKKQVSSFNGKEYLFCVKGLNEKNIIEDIFPYVFVNFIKDREEIFELIRLFCVDLVESTGKYNITKYLHILFEEKLKIKIDVKNKYAFIQKNKDFLNDFYKRHKMYNRLEETSNDNILEDFFKILFFTIYCSNKGLENNYLDFLNKTILDKFREKNINEFLYTKIKSNYETFFYNEFNEAFPTFIQYFKNILKRIELNTSLSTISIMQNFKNNYKNFLEKNYNKNLFTINTNLKNNKNMVEYMNVIFNNNINFEDKEKIEDK